MSGSEETSVRIDSSGSIGGHSVQAGAIHGDVHLHQAETTTVPRQLPPSVRHFVNRAVEQDALTTLLGGASTDGVVLISTLDGTAGVGKSSLAVHWAHRTRDRFPDGELYVNLRGFDPASEPMTSAEALGAFLAGMDVPPERIPADADARAAMFRSTVHGKRMLMLLDNASSAEQVRPLLPGTPTCLVLVTSRNRLDDLVIREGAARMTLEVLNRAEARDLLGRYLGNDRLDAEPQAVDDLIEQCAGLPLALGIVAVRSATDPDCPIADLVAELRDERERLDGLDLGGETGIRAVFSWSYHSLPTESARMFRLLGLPTGPDISLAAAADLAGIPQRQARTRLAELVRANLVEQHNPGRYRLHDLLRAYAAECATTDEPHENRQAATRRLLDHYLRTSRTIDRRLVSHSRQFEPVAPPSDIEGLTFDDDLAATSWWANELPNVLGAVRQAAELKLNEHAWQLPHSLMYYFHLRGLNEAWITTYEIALNAVRELGDRQAEANLLADLGTAYYDLGEHTAAVQHEEDSLRLFDVLGDDSRKSQLLVALGESHTLLRNYEYATEVLQRALELDRASGDQYGQGVANGVLGSIYAELNKFDKAFQCFQEALHLYQEVGEKVGKGFVLNFLGDAYRKAGRSNDAVGTYREAVTYRSEIGHRKGEALSLRGLGDALREVDDPYAAREAWQQALEILEELGDSEADAVRTKLAES